MCESVAEKSWQAVLVQFEFHRNSEQVRKGASEARPRSAPAGALPTFLTCSRCVVHFQTEPAPGRHQSGRSSAAKVIMFAASYGSLPFLNRLQENEIRLIGFFCSEIKESPSSQD
jgi:hypothetical protein